MTLTNEKRLIRHEGNGATTNFPYDFLIPDANSVIVSLWDEATDTTTVLNASQYNITGLGDPNFGEVTYPLSGSPIAAGTWLVIEREVAYTQDLLIKNQGGFFADSTMAQLDRIVMQTQQLAEMLERTPKFSPGSGVSNIRITQGDEGTALIWDADGNIVEGPSAAEIGSAQTYATEAKAARNAAQDAQSAAEDAADRAEQAAAGVEYPVSYAPQTLTPAEQGQARANIGVGHTFKTVAALLADETMSYTSGAGLIEVGSGDIIEAQGFRYEVADAGASDSWLVETAGGVKLRPLPNSEGVITVRQCGAQGGELNSTSDQVAFETAVAAAKLDGGRVFIDPLTHGGEYYLYRWDIAGVDEVFGAGTNSYVKARPGDWGDNTSRSFAPVEINGSLEAPVKRPYVHDFLIDGNKDNITAANTLNLEGLNGHYTEDAIAERLIIINTHGDGIDWDFSLRPIARNCWSINCGGYGVHQSEGCVDAWTDGCVAILCGDNQRGGFDSYVGTLRGKITNCIAIECWRGITSASEDGCVENNKVFDSTLEAILIGGSTGGGTWVSDGITVKDNLVIGADGAGISVTQGSRHKIKGNNVYDAQSHGIVIGTGSLAVKDSIISGNIMRNVADSSGARTIFVQQHSTGNLVSGNHCLRTENNGKIMECANPNNEFRDNITGFDQEIGEVKVMRMKTTGPVAAGDIFTGAVTLESTQVAISNFSGSIEQAPAVASQWRALGPCEGTNHPTVADRIQLFRRVT